MQMTCSLLYGSPPPVLGLPVGEVVRQHAPARVVVVSGRRPLLEERLVPAVEPLLRPPDRRDDPVPVAHAGTLRPRPDSRA